MKYQLEPLRLAGLSNLEAGQLVKRNLSDIDSLDPALITNEPLKNYLTRLKASEATYEKALLQVQVNEESAKIAAADGSRDKSVSVIVSAISLHSKSDDAAEVEAAHSLSILMNTYKGITEEKYEAESLGLDKMVEALESDAYKAKVELLGMGRYVTRVKETNEAFKALFGNRLVVEAATVSYNAKQLRKELYSLYNETTQYIVSMANALDTPEFVKVLELINEARSYYANQLARSQGVKDKATEEAKGSVN